MDIEQLESEAAEVRRRYDRRLADSGAESVYHPTRLDRVLLRQRKEMHIARRLRERWLTRIATARVLEVGCGSGANLAMFMSFGFAPENLCGVELLEERVAAAHRLLPPGISVTFGDATRQGFAAESFDIIIQSTVFSSILDRGVRAELARQMWTWLRPGGEIYWYDLAVDNPRNRDVVGIPRREIHALFPEGSIECRRITLAPPIARRIKRAAWLYRVLDAVPLLRSHTLAWIAKR
jgi:SAM-dependent methyltransferase